MPIFREIITNSIQFGGLGVYMFHNSYCFHICVHMTCECVCYCRYVHTKLCIWSSENSFLIFHLTLRNQAWVVRLEEQALLSQIVSPAWYTYSYLKLSEYKDKVDIFAVNVNTILSGSCLGRLGRQTKWGIPFSTRGWCCFFKVRWRGYIALIIGR